MAEELKSFGSWWPFTFAGVARYARRPLASLLFLQLIVAAFAGGAVMIYLRTAAWRLLPEAIAQCPKDASISNGALQWPNKTSVTLAHNSHAAIIVDPLNTGHVGEPSDLQIELRERSWRLRSILGFNEFPYADGKFSLDPAELKPAWEAWKPAWLVAGGVATILGLFVSWALLAMIYAPIAKLIAYFGNHKLSWSEAWCLCGAVLMPGAVLLSLAILLYGLERINLFNLGLAFAIHFLVGFAYLVFAPLRLPLLHTLETEENVSNPFKPAAERKPPSKNPFKS